MKYTVCISNSFTVSHFNSSVTKVGYPVLNNELEAFIVCQYTVKAYHRDSQQDSCYPRASHFLQGEVKGNRLA